MEPPLGTDWSLTHAALPVVDLEDPGGGWLYVSTRDAEGRARIGRARLELDRGEARASALEPEPALGLGELGSFDDSGVTGACLVNHDGRKYLYYSGWSLGRSVPFYFYVGLAVSEDGGESFTRVSPAPVLERSEVDPYLTASPSVIVEDGLWRMWYVSGTGWEVVDGEPRHRYHLKYAESSDGVSWRREGRVCIDYAGGGEYALARPCVLRDEDAYRMWFAARGDAYRIGYAESGDGLSWERRDEEAGISPSAEGWDSEMQEYPLVLDREGTRYMLYNGNGYGATGVGYAVRTP